MTADSRAGNAPATPNQFAKRIFDITTGEVEIASQP